MSEFSFQVGDIAACFGTDPSSKVIRYGTARPFAPRGLRLGPSHVAVACEHGPDVVWVESTTMARTPCLVASEPVSGVQVQNGFDRCREYVDGGGWVEVYRLSAIDSLSRDESAVLSKILLGHFVRERVRYDLGGALLSGTRVLQASKLFPNANLNALFCSELVAAVLQRIGRMNHANPARYNPARLLRELVATGKYRRVWRYSKNGGEWL